ncbi:MAG: glutaredoxin 3 [Rickettsiaceae bacterium]|nr:glutaredoxin 3 [Rickettsiaceae bacterium]
MKKIEIFTTTYCPYCVKAKTLLKAKNLEFEEIDVTEDQEMRIALVEKSGGRKTVPQIFIGGVHIGGCDDLYELDKNGSLESYL